MAASESREDRFARIRKEYECMGKSPAIIERLMALVIREEDSHEACIAMQSAILKFVPVSTCAENPMLDVICSYIYHPA